VTPQSTYPTQCRSLFLTKVTAEAHDKRDSRLQTREQLDLLVQTTKDVLESIRQEAVDAAYADPHMALAFSYLRLAVEGVSLGYEHTTCRSFTNCTIVALSV
jgi:hypothetical protein